MSSILSLCKFVRRLLSTTIILVIKEHCEDSRVVDKNCIAIMKYCQCSGFNELKHWLF